MATAKTDALAEGPTPPGRAELCARIGRHVLGQIGGPAGKLTPRVHRLWGNFYRVNMVTDDGVGTVRIPNSYFLEADAEGNVLTSTPAITRQG